MEVLDVLDQSSAVGMGDQVAANSRQGCMGRIRDQVVWVLTEYDTSENARRGTVFKIDSRRSARYLGFFG